MNCIADFSEELSKLTLSEHSNSLFMFYGKALEHRHDVAMMPSECDDTEIINSGFSNKTRRHNRSSSSGFSVVRQEPGTFIQTFSADGVKCEASRDRQSRCRVTNQSSDTMQSDSTSQHSSPVVRSWATVLAEGKTAKQPTLASIVRGNQNDQTKPSKCSSIRSSGVNHPGGLNVRTQSRADKLKCRSASRDGDRMQLLSSDGNRNRMKSHDRVSDRYHENCSAAFVTVHNKKTKPRSQTPQLRSDAATHLAGSCVNVESKQEKRGEIAIVGDSAVSSSQSKAAKQKKKKKKKSKGSDVAVDEASDAMQETRQKIILPVPEFHNVDEFPSLFSSKSVSKKTALQTSMSTFTSGIFVFFV